MTGPTWPALPEDWSADPATVAKYRELLLAAEIDLAKTHAEGRPVPPVGLDKDASEVRLHESLGTIIAASIDRARDGAKFVETAAAALGTVYTGILAFAFAASGTHLPVRGIYAAIYLGLAIVGSSFYLAFVQRVKSIGRVHYLGSKAEDQWRRTEYLAAWTRAIVETRAWALRTAVIALAFGVVFMPAAFLPDRLEVGFAMPPAASPPAAAPTWPPPPTGIQDPDLAKILYKAQLDAFAAGTSTASSATSTAGVSADLAALGLFGAGVVVLVITARWPAGVIRARRRRTTDRPAAAP